MNGITKKGDRPTDRGMILQSHTSNLPGFLGHFSDREPWSYQSFAILELNPIIAYYIYTYTYIYIYMGWTRLKQMA